MDPTVPFHPVEIQTFAAQKELLMRREERAMYLAAMEELADEEECNIMPGNCIIPSVMFIPDMIHWNPPRPGKMHDYQRLQFAEHGMRNVVEDTMPLLLPAYDSMMPNKGADININLGRIQLWAICAIYRYGGVFAGDRLVSPNQKQHVDEMLYSSTSVISHSFLPNPTAIVVLDPSTESISMLASTPRHPLLRCALLQLENLILHEQTLDTKVIMSSLLLSLTSADFHFSSSKGDGDDSWKRLSTSSILDGHACDMYFVESLGKALEESDLIESDGHDARHFRDTDHQQR